MHNLDLKQKIKRSGFFQYEIAEKIGISEYTLCTWLRKELSYKQKQTVLSAIQSLQELYVQNNHK